MLQAEGAAHDPIIRLGEIHALRHSFRQGGHEEIQKPEDLYDPKKLLAYTRAQGTRRFPADPPRYWAVFLADGGRRTRLHCVFENRGEVRIERTNTYRYYDLRPSSFLAPLADRLVIEWGRDTINWNRPAAEVAHLPVLERRA
ncbi:hypothetical protein [Sinomonas sp. P47F7]|uniref:hypothetical protein n=1 Tax=Sinomonas sp. P47F7 TaxID=3410987 RepID=UPI003BF60828